MKFKLLLFGIALIFAQYNFSSMKQMPSSQKSNTAHKIVYLISPPRSLSVAFMRMMAARGDFAIIHEPSQLPLCKQKGFTQAEEWFLKGTASCFQDVTNLILEKAKTSNVFVKEMVTAAELLLQDNSALVKNPNVYFVFLMRNPHHTIISFSKKSTVSGDATTFSYLTGYKILYELYNYLSENAVHKPYLILTEDLYNNPEKTLKGYCAYLKIPYLPQALQWESLGSEFTGQKEWGEVKKTGAIQHWHADALKSTGLEKPQQYKVDAKGNPTFEEIENPDYKKVAMQAYRENLPYYNNLLKFYSTQEKQSVSSTKATVKTKSRHKI